MVVDRMQGKQLSTLSCCVLTFKRLTVTLPVQQQSKHAPGPLPTCDPQRRKLAASNKQ